MKKSPSIIAICVLLVVLALRLLSGHPSVSGHGALRLLSVGYLALAVLSLVTVQAVWHESTGAVRLFGVWAIAYLSVFATAQVLTDCASPVEAAVWWLFAGAVLLSVGMHLRYVSRRAV